MGFYDDLLAEEQNAQQQNMQNMQMQGMPMQGMQMMQGMPMQGVTNMPMQGMPMQGMPNMPMQGMPNMQMQGMPNMQMQGMYNMNMPMQNMQMGMYDVGYQNNQGYGYGQPTGRTDRYGFVKYTRQEILQGLKNHIIEQTGMGIMREEKLEEYPELLRHACVESEEKISQLGICFFDVPAMSIRMPFYFCKACGKLFYYKDFM